jgi:FtsH-binding integral membrane protein
MYNVADRSPLSRRDTGVIGAETPRPTRESDQLAAVAGEQRDAREDNSFEVITGPPDARNRRTSGTYTALALPALYFLLGAVAVTMWLWRDPASRLVAGNPNDTDQFAWYFRYSATAVAHFQLPGMVTDGMNAPQGISVMWNTFMLLPGMLLAPVTLLAGPQASLTVLMTAGFAGSALAMFVVLRRWDASILAAALGGAIYGFSPALIQSSLGHYDLQFAVLPPLIANAALRLLTGRYGAGGRAAARCGAWLGLLVAAQVFIAEELLFDTGIAVLVMAVVTMASRPRALAGRVREVATGLVAGTGVAAVIAGYPLLVQFFGPLRQQSSPFTPDFFKNDLAGLVQPSSFMLLHTTSSAAFANAFQARAPEYLAYLGWPMLIVLAIVTVLFFRLPPVRVTALTFAVLAVLSLGGTLLVGGHEHAGIKLPWYWLQTLPVTGAVIPDRFSIIADGAAAAAFAFGFDAARRRWPAAGAPLSGPAAGAPLGHPAAVRRIANWIVGGLAALAVIPLIPAPLPAASTPSVPAGWTATISALRLSAHATVLVVPIPVSTFTEPLRWQADTGQPASMVGGYYMGPTWSGQAATDGNGLSSEAMYLNQLWAESAGVSVASVATLPVNQIYPDAIQMRAQFAGWHVSAIVAVTSRDSAFGRYLTRLLGQPTAQSGQVLGWRLHQNGQAS